MSAPRRYEEVPGPRGVPFFGNAFQFDKRRVHEQFAEWVQEYGPYVRVRIGPRDLLLVADHAVIGSVLRDRPQRFRRPSNQAKIAREMGFDDGLFFANDDVWKRAAPHGHGGARPRARQGVLSFAEDRRGAARGPLAQGRTGRQRSSTCRPT